MRHFVSEGQHLPSRKGPDYRIKHSHLSWLENLLDRLPHLFEIVNPELVLRYEGFDHEIL